MFFKDIVGQQEIKSHLIRMVEDERVSHAQLFSGLEGVGSLPMALAFSQYLNCLNPTKEDSCGECSSCVKAAKLIHPDIHFVFPVIKEGNSTPLSDNFIANWRSQILKAPYFSLDQWLSQITDTKKTGMIYAEESSAIFRKLSMKNFEGRYKIMIIWLPERMNETGANKLLKLLEEPPQSTVFILVSENPALLLPTILSRTQQLHFPAIKTEDVAACLSEKYHIPNDQVSVAARLARGNFAQALINLNMLEEKSAYFELFADMMRSVYSRKIFELIRWVDEVAPLSRDKQKGYLDYSINMLRESYIFNFQHADLNFLNPHENDFVQKFSRFINLENVAPMVKELELAHAHIEQNGNARMVLFDTMIKIIPLFKA